MAVDLDAVEYPEDETNSRWDGYSDYRFVSLRVATTIDNALDAYSRIDGAHSEGAKVGPELAAEARARIMSAVLKLIPEMRRDAGSVELYAEILDRWEGEDGYVRALDEVSFREQCPGWLFQMMLDIRSAGWELGYLQAGRTEKASKDPVTDQVTSMFDE